MRVWTSHDVCNEIVEVVDILAILVGFKLHVAVFVNDPVDGLNMRRSRSTDNFDQSFFLVCLDHLVDTDILFSDLQACIF